jgi:triosephosphate isomerase
LQIDRRKFRLASQNAYHKDSGAFTGETSFTMLRDLVHYGIIGHSERRHVFGESLDLVSEKVTAAVRNNIMPILCVGETKTERLAGHTKRVIHDQVVTAVKGLTSTEIKDIVIAYEPVWAIGTGEVAKPDQVEQAVKFIRHNIAELYGVRASEKVRVLYGGSVVPEVASGFLAVEGVDGFLVGGASINYHQFSSIVDIAYKQRTELGENS